MKYLQKAEKYFLGGAMLGTTVLLFTNVTLRYFFHSALFWAEEVLRYLIVWIIFIGISTCVRERTHISVDVLSNIGSKRLKKLLNLFVDLVGILFGVSFLWFSIQFILRIKASGQMSATLGGVPMYLVYLCLPIGFFLYALCSGENLLIDLRAKGQKPDPPADQEGGEER